MSSTRIIILTTLAMIAFAGNSVLCRAALTDTNIDAASFTAIRLTGYPLDVSRYYILWSRFSIYSRYVDSSMEKSQTR